MTAENRAVSVLCSVLGLSKLHCGFWSEPFQVKDGSGRVYSLCHCLQSILLANTVKKSHRFAELRALGRIPLNKLPNSSCRQAATASTKWVDSGARMHCS